MIRKLIRKRKRLPRKAKKNNDQWQKFKKTRNTVINEIRKSKQKYYYKLTEELNAKKTKYEVFLENI